MDESIKLEQEFDLVFKAHYSLVKNFALMLLKSGQDADEYSAGCFYAAMGPNRRFGRTTPG